MMNHIALYRSYDLRTAVLRSNDSPTVYRGANEIGDRDLMSDEAPGTRDTMPCKASAKSKKDRKTQRKSKPSLHSTNSIVMCVNLQISTTM